MDGVGQWRLVESQEEEEKERSTAEVPAASNQRTTFLLITATVALVTAEAGLAIWATLPSGGVFVEQRNGMAGAAFAQQLGSDIGASIPSATDALEASNATVFVVVDVQGAVVRPGVHQLSSGSRVADAIAAAGGYAQSIDIAAASRQLNLAEKLTDGTQIHVPALGEVIAAPAATASVPGSAAGGLIELNSATAEQLDTLPGIGPVTTAKIIDARAQAPFGSVDELLARGVVGASTFEKIRDLVTVAP